MHQHHTRQDIDTTTENEHLPGILQKASVDHYTYLLQTKSGQQIAFSEITPRGTEWIHLHEHNLDPEHLSGFFNGVNLSNIMVVGDRGLDIRLDAIEWVADASS